MQNHDLLGLAPHDFEQFGEREAEREARLDQPIRTGFPVLDGFNLHNALALIAANTGLTYNQAHLQGGTPYAEPHPDDPLRVFLTLDLPGAPYYRLEVDTTWRQLLRRIEADLTLRGMVGAILRNGSTLTWVPQRTAPTATERRPQHRLHLKEWADNATIELDLDGALPDILQRCGKLYVRERHPDAESIGVYIYRRADLRDLDKENAECAK